MTEGRRLPHVTAGLDELPSCPNTRDIHNVAESSVPPAARPRHTDAPIASADNKTVAARDDQRHANPFHVDRQLSDQPSVSSTLTANSGTVTCSQGLSLSKWREDCRSPLPKRTYEILRDEGDVAKQSAAPLDNRHNYRQASKRCWDELDTYFVRHDEGLVKSWKESMDTLLVFAGLFSGVVTAFNIQYFTTLVGPPAWSAQSTTTTLNVADLTRLAGPDGTLPPHVLLAAAGTYQPPKSAVIINSLWFSSLVYSLIAASLATLVKQWVQHYNSQIYAVSRERTRIREHRFDGVQKWLLPQIIAFLPLIVRAALTLFLVGVIVFLQTLNTLVTWIVTVPIMLWLVVYTASVVLPAVYSSCPYKAPESSAFYLFSRLFVERDRPPLYRVRSVTWQDREHRLRNRRSLDISMLVTADLTFADELLATTIRQCISELDDHEIAVVIRKILCQRLRLPPDMFRPPGRVTKFPKQITLTEKCVSAVMDIILDTLGREVDRQAGTNGTTEATVLNLNSPQLLRGMNFMTIVLTYSADVEDTTFDDRLLQFLRELLVPLKTSAEMAWHTIRILSTRPALVTSGLATKYLMEHLTTLTRHTMNERWMGRPSVAVPACKLVLQMWRYAPFEVIQIDRADVEELFNEMAKYVAGVVATRSSVPRGIVDDCLDIILILEDPRAAGKQACHALKSVLLAIKGTRPHAGHSSDDSTPRKIAEV